MIQKEILIDLYRKMVLTRKLEEKHDQLLKEGKLHLMGHFGTGQESVGVGVGAGLDKDDYLFPTHRGVAEYIGKGMAAKDICAEYFGKITGLSKGKGAIHLADANKGIMGLVGSLGADFSIAVGTALASKMQGNSRVTLCYFGEGTSNQGDFHPALNMASIWQLPVVYVCVNNQYTEFAHYRQTTATEHIAPRAAAYGIPYEIVDDGNDVVGVYEATKKAVEKARAGEGPYFIEFKTYRVANHYTGDQGGYRSQEEVEQWKKQDPINRFRKYLAGVGFDAKELDQLDENLTNEIEESFNLAMNAPYPDSTELYTDVFYES